MVDALRQVLAADSRVAFALLFGSEARGHAHAHSDVDVALTLEGTATTLAVGDLTAQLERATGRRVHVVLLNQAPPGLAYRVFREGTPLVIRDRSTFSIQMARAILEYLDFKPVEELFTRGVLRAGMVDETLLAAKIGAVRDAADRVRTMLPGNRDQFLGDRTVREVVLLNVFVALQECMS